jgi:hypothetical protein
MFQTSLGGDKKFGTEKLSTEEVWERDKVSAVRSLKESPTRSAAIIIHKAEVPGWTWHAVSETVLVSS